MKKMKKMKKTKWMKKRKWMKRRKRKRLMVLRMKLNENNYLMEKEKM
jgi:hypothetical protein